MLEHIKGILFDLDGTLFCQGKAIEGAKETVESLRQMGYKLRFLTNTDSRTRKDLCRRICERGIQVQEQEIHTPIEAARQYLTGKKGKVMALVHDQVMGCFPNQVKGEEVAEYVVIGDFCDKVSYELLNTAFNHINAGALMIAAKESPYYLSSEGKQLDTGAFVAMLEYASHKKAKIVGKPAPEFFMTTIHDMGLQPEEVMVIGDDISTDIAGAIGVGAVSVLVKTGKYQHMNLDAYGHIHADYVLDSVKDLLDLWNK